jgi:hypothetical protein
MLISVTMVVLDDDGGTSKSVMAVAGGQLSETLCLLPSSTVRDFELGNVRMLRGKAFAGSETAESTSQNKHMSTSQGSRHIIHEDPGGRHRIAHWLCANRSFRLIPNAWSKWPLPQACRNTTGCSAEPGDDPLALHVLNKATRRHWTSGKQRVLASSCALCASVIAHHRILLVDTAVPCVQPASSSL